MCVCIWMCTSSCRLKCACVVVHSLHTCDAQEIKLHWCTENRHDSIKRCCVCWRCIWHVQFWGNILLLRYPGSLITEWGVLLWEVPSSINNHRSSSVTQAGLPSSCSLYSLEFLLSLYMQAWQYCEIPDSVPENMSCPGLWWSTQFWILHRRTRF